MITPVNGHIIIEPLVHEGFIASQNDSFEEIGTVVSIPLQMQMLSGLEVGDKVYFDAWLSAKYPKGEGEEFYWLVKYEDVRAIEKRHVESQPLSE